MLILILSCLMLPDVQPPAVTAYSASTAQVALEPADRDSYILGPGDMLDVLIEGGSTPSSLASGLYPQSVCSVTSDGMLGVSGIGMVYVSGLSIAEAEIELRALARRYYAGGSVRISLHTPRLVRVTASGAVVSPGTYSLYALQTVSDLMAACGGPTALCSRSGTVISDGDPLDFDLVIRPGMPGPPSDPLLTDGSVVLFDICTDPAFVTREPVQATIESIPTPAIQAWQMDGPMPLADFLDMVGGSGGDFNLAGSVLSSGGTHSRVWTGEGLADMPVGPGDTLFLARQRLLVTVSGAVTNPTQVDWQAGLTCGGYISRAGGMIPGASTGGISVLGPAGEVARGADALAYVPTPGDLITVPYTWASRNADFLAVVSTLISSVALVYSLTR